MLNHDSKVEPIGAMADTIHAEIARYLNEPSKLQADYDDKSQNSICDSTVLHQLLLFRGFITKIKHNGLRRFIPCTLRLLATLGLEIDFFKSISPAYVTLREAGPIPIEKHLLWFFHEMDSWLSCVQPQYRVLISDLLSHENTIVDFHNFKNEIVANPIPNAPRFIGKVFVRQYKTDVLVATDKLSSGKFDPNTDFIERPVNLIYHQVQNRSASILEIDFFLAILLSLVDGKRTVDEMARMLMTQGISEATPKSIHLAFNEVVGRGMLVYKI